MTAREARKTVADLNLPVFDQPQKEWWPRIIPWEVVMRETQSVREYYRAHYDSPERRLRDKNPEPFCL